MRVSRHHKLVTTPLLVGITVTLFLVLASAVSIGAGVTGQEKKPATPGEIQPVWPPPPAEARVEYVRSISSPRDVRLKAEPWWEKVINFLFGVGKRDHLVRPFGVTTFGGKIYVADPGDVSVWEIDPAAGKMSRLIEGERGKLQMPIGVAVAGDGRLFVSDSAAGCVAVFGTEGKSRGKRLGEIREKMQRPTGLALDRERGRLYVADTMTHSVHVYDTQTLHHLFDIGRRGGGKGEFNFPAHLALAGGKLYVTDEMNFRIQVFDREGKFLSAFGHLGDGAGDFARPKGVAVDSEGHIYVVDALFDNVQIFDEQGRLLLFIGGPGRKPGEFWLPSEIWIDEHDNIYISDSYNRRLQVLRYLGN